METKENVEVKNQPVAEEAVKESKETNDSTTEHISEKPDKSEDIIKSQTGQIQKLQKEIEELKKQPDLKTALKDLLGEEKVESDVEPLDALKSKLDSLTEQITKKDAEIAKNNYIDGLEVTEPVKKYLKTKVQATDNLEEAVKKEVELVNELIENATPKTTDSRPKGIGSVSGSSTNMNFVLEHPELFKKK